MSLSLAALSRGLARGAIAFAGLGLILMTAIISAQVVARHFVGQSLAWSEQAALVLMIWSILPAAAAGVREGFHVRVGLFADAGPRRARICALLAHGCTALFGLAMAVWGSELVVRTWAHEVPTLPIPRGATYLPLPLAGLMVLFFAAEHLRAVMRGLRVEPLWP